MKSLSDYKIGDVLLLTSRNRTGEEVRSAQVFDINYNGNGLVTYIGTDWPGIALPTGSGAFDPAEIGTKPYGFTVKVEKVGHRQPWRPWSPRPGDRAYDLMC